VAKEAVTTSIQRCDLDLFACQQANTAKSSVENETVQSCELFSGSQKI
jgi:hypothetical protein